MRLSRRSLLAHSAGLASLAALPIQVQAQAPGRKIILDTDPGVDDAMALLLLHGTPGISIVGITTAAGNGLIETTTHNALYLADRFGITAPVAKGQGASLDGVTSSPPVTIHGRNALGDIPLPAIRKKLDPRPAHDLMIDLVRANPHEITLVATGHMTNLALALRKAPEIAGLVREVVLMGGAFGYHGARGNVTPAAEANFHGDPRAADEICAAGWPLTIVGLDVTTQTIMTDAYFTDLRQHGGKSGQFLWDITRVYMTFHHGIGLNGIYVNDASAAAYVIAPELFKTQKGSVRVATESVALGESILKADGRVYPTGDWDHRPSVQVCTDVNAEGVRVLFRNAILQLG
ncbi:inosine-uridine preferring nucleoside hydrolase [Gluconobacter frateurii M-2]|nr:inosine-uridine preferring nucleoside hydrolase [Gluconobacter frateurii M-2]